MQSKEVFLKLIPQIGRGKLNTSYQVMNYIQVVRWHFPDIRESV